LSGKVIQWLTSDIRGFKLDSTVNKNTIKKFCSLTTLPVCLEDIVAKVKKSMDNIWLCSQSPTYHKIFQ